MQRLAILGVLSLAVAVPVFAGDLPGNLAGDLPKVDVSIQIIKDDDDVARSLTLHVEPLASEEQLHALAPFDELDAPLRPRPYGTGIHDGLMAMEVDGVDAVADLGDSSPVEVAVAPASF